MTVYLSILLFIFFVYAFSGFAKGYYESARRKNPYGLSTWYVLIGSFVWGDAVVFGLFWSIASLVCLLLQDIILFFLIVSTFWFVRSVGETIYWLNQQFSQVKREPPEKKNLHRFFPQDSVWFAHQTISQCISITSFIFMLYFAKLWLLS